MFFIVMSVIEAGNPDKEDDVRLSSEGRMTPHVEISKKKYDEKLAKMMSSVEKPSSGEEKEDKK